MVNSTISLKKSSRIVGLLFLLQKIAIIYGVFYVSYKIGISGTDEMAKNIMSNDFLFRFGIISRLFSTIPSILLAITLYKLLHEVNSFQAKVMLAWLILAIPFQFVSEVFNITSIMVAN